MRVHLALTPGKVLAILLVVLAVMSYWAWSGSQHDNVTLPAGAVTGTSAVIIIPDSQSEDTTAKDLARYLRENGRIVRVVKVSADLNESAQNALGLMGQMQASRIVTFDLVGFSDGGLVARSIVGQSPRLVRRVVTIASAHKGNTLSQFINIVGNGKCEPACNQEQTGSAFLAGLPQSGNGRWLSVYASSDESIAPRNSPELEGAVNIDLSKACAQNYSHATLIQSKATWHLLATFLARGSLPDYCTYG